jgi:hypothetical protein
VIKAACACLAVGAVAFAEPPPPKEPEPDPAVQNHEANLESNAARQGFVFTFAFGGAVTLGFGVNDSTGTGGAGTVRLAHVATPHSLVTLEVVGSALFHQVTEGMGADAKTSTYTNQLTNFMVGAQVYANPALWFRTAAGIGRYKGDHVLLESRPGTPQMRGDLHLLGPSLSIGAGVDIIRLKRFRMSAELQGTGLINREGLLSSGGFLLGLTID